MGKYKNDDNDKYLLQNNLLGIKTYEELEEAEAFAFSLRAAELERDEYRIGAFTVESFKRLHEHLFQDIYPFAGQFRDVQLMKGSTRFCQSQYISTNVYSLFNQLNKEIEWENLEEAATRLAFFKSEFNMIHPFREGNGRTIRIFIREYALSRFISWKYEQVDRETYMQAMIQSVTNPDRLRQLFLGTISYSE
ncbi:Fic/DOC family protein [Virgibacillus sp. W0181]|uniref:Fic/DOC family protein n=1 Tax=Virgibacillus sp. W0181 TaxID=3391581 RepID=UPI003F473B69